MGGGLAVAVLGLGRGLWRDVGLMVGPALVGAVVLARAEPVRFSAVAMLALIDAVYSVVVNPMGLRDEQCGIITALTVLAVGGYGFVVVTRGLVDRDRRFVWPMTVALLAVGSARMSVAVERRPNVELRRADALVHHVIDQMPPDGLAIVASDHLASLCAHAQVAEGSRPDALCAPAVFTRDRAMLRVLSRRGDRGFRAARRILSNAKDRTAMSDAMAAWVRPAIAQGGLSWELGSAAEDAQVVAHWLPGFPAGEISASRPSNGEFTGRLAAATRRAKAWCSARRCPVDGDAASYVGRWASLTASAALRVRRPGARDLLELAMLFAPSDRSVMNNRAVFLNISGEHAAALDVCERALQLHPDHHVVLRTATRAALALNDSALAAKYARDYLQTPIGRRTGRRWLEGLLAAAPAVTREQLLRALTPSM